MCVCVFFTFLAIWSNRLNKPNNIKHFTRYTIFYCITFSFSRCFFFLIKSLGEFNRNCQILIVLKLKSFWFMLKTMNCFQWKFGSQALDANHIFYLETSNIAHNLTQSKKSTNNITQRLSSIL